MTTSTTCWTPEMLAALEDTRPVIARVLCKAGRGAETNDVVQNTWLAAHQSLSTYDPGRASFKVWIGSIGWRQAHRYLREEMRKERLQGAVEAEAASGAVTGFDVIGEDFAEEVLSRVTNWQSLVEVLETAKALMDAPHLLERSVRLLVSFEGHAAPAAQALGVSVSALRDSHRKVLDMVQVIEKALELHWARKGAGTDQEPVSIQELLGCLPCGEGQCRAWAQELSGIITEAGELEQLCPEAVVARTGWSRSYARQCLSRVRELLAVALTVIESGHITPEQG